MQSKNWLVVLLVVLLSVGILFDVVGGSITFPYTIHTPGFNATFPNANNPQIQIFSDRLNSSRTTTHIISITPDSISELQVNDDELNKPFQNLEVTLNSNQTAIIREYSTNATYITTLINETNLMGIRYFTTFSNGAQWEFNWTMTTADTQVPLPRPLNYLSCQPISFLGIPITVLPGCLCNTTYNLPQYTLKYGYKLSNWHFAPITQNRSSSSSNATQSNSSTTNNITISSHVNLRANITLTFPLAQQSSPNSVGFTIGGDGVPCHILTWNISVFGGRVVIPLSVFVFYVSDLVSAGPLRMGSRGFYASDISFVSIDFDYVFDFLFPQFNDSLTFDPYLQILTNFDAASNGNVNGDGSGDGSVNGDGDGAKTKSRNIAIGVTVGVVGFFFIIVIIVLIIITVVVVLVKIHKRNSYNKPARV